MARVSNFWSRGRAATAVWIISAILFYFILRAVMENSTSPSPEFAAWSSVERSRLYDKMAQDLDEHGLKFLQGGETSQSMSLNDIFELKGGSVTPKHKAADPPVRANVLYLSPEFSNPISQVVRDIFLPYFVGAIWFQNASLYHFSMFHASHHLTPTKATEAEIEDEVSAVKAVAQSLCPLQIILDRVVLTSTGVLLGCWQMKYYVVFIGRRPGVYNTWEECHKNVVMYSGALFRKVNSKEEACSLLQAYLEQHQNQLPSTSQQNNNIRRILCFVLCLILLLLSVKYILW